jgi:putative endonuclease
MGGYVYLLSNIKNDWHYIGSTKDLKQRIEKHQKGTVKSTKFQRPLKLIYYEAYSNYSLAKKREYQLKNHNQSKELLYKQLGIL